MGPIVSKNNGLLPWVDPHQPCEFYGNRFKTTTCILCFCTYINNYPAQFLSEQGSLETNDDRTNVKHMVGRQTIKISHAVSQLNLTQHSLVRCLAGHMTMHACQIGPTDTAPPCPRSPIRACVGTKGGMLWGRQPFCPH